MGKLSKIHSKFDMVILLNILSSISLLLAIRGLAIDAISTHKEPVIEKVSIMFKLIFLLIISCAGFGFKPAQAATVQCIDNETSGFISFFGSISAGDYEKVEDCWKKLTRYSDEHIALLEEPNKEESGRNVLVEKSIIYFIISSTGGLVSEAMEIGRFVRDKEITVVVPAEGGECFSSCIYILAAGVERWPWGHIGIHRPYFLSSPTQSYDTALKNILEQSKVYFREMNVPEVLVDDMFSVPPDDLKILEDVMLSKYRLNQVDMAYQEKTDMMMAREYGLSRQEYLRRIKLEKMYFNDCLAKLSGKFNPTHLVVDVVVECSMISREKAGLTFIEQW